MIRGATLWARRTLESAIFHKPPVWFKIWFFLVSQAQHKDYKGLKRGQCYVTYATICLQCAATRNEVDHAIRYMKKEEMLATRKATRGMVVTISNYETYQNMSNYKSDSKSDSKATQDAICGDTKATQKRQDKQVCINEKNGDKKTTCVDFDVFWKAYPKKRSKDAALRRWTAMKPDAGLLETMLVAIEQQKKSEQWLKDDGQFIPYPATWLNAGGWKDELPAPKETMDERLARLSELD